MNNYDNVANTLQTMGRISKESLGRNLKYLAPQIIEAFLFMLKSNPEFEINVFKEFWQKYSFITLDLIENELCVELKRKQTTYELTLLYYREEQASYKHKLKKSEEDLLPAELKKLFSVVRDLGNKVSFSSSSLNC
jgi:hypothetical protein